MERIPILKMGDLLLVTIQVDMHDRLVSALQDDLTNKIAATGAHGVLIDISALDMVDSFIGRMIGNIAGMSRVLDAETVLVGMQPSVAITLVELGLSLEGVRTALDVEKGWTSCGRRSGGASRRAAMGVTKHDGLEIRSPNDVVLVRQAVRKWTTELGFGLVDQTKMITAASELARNTLDYGGGGTVRLEALQEGPRRGLRLTFEDQGPGIPDIALALTDGYTSGKGMGMGLSGSSAWSTSSRSTPGSVRDARVNYEVEVSTPPGQPVALAIDDVSMVGEARRAAVVLAGRLGFGETGRGEVALVVTEARRTS
jgi:rsbT antagonist protein RsbS